LSGCVTKKNKKYVAVGISLDQVGPPASAFVCGLLPFDCFIPPVSK